MKSLLFAIGLCALTFSANGQITTPQPSPGATVTQNVGLAELKIEYSRPSAKGRKIFGDLVQFDQIWRTGANSATKFTTSDSLTVLGVGLPKGTYVITTRPGRYEWEVIFNKNLSSSASNPKPEDDVVKVKVKPEAIPFKVETFTMGFGSITPSSANLEIYWEDTYIAVPFTQSFETKVMAQIKQKLDGPTQGDYYAMSTFYFENNKGNAEALDFVNKALAKGERFWMLRHKSLVQAKMGDAAGAVESAKRSLELAKEAKNDDYIRMNEKSIMEWTKK